MNKKEALHYLKLLQQSYLIMQPEIRESINFAIKSLDDSQESGESFKKAKAVTSVGSDQNTPSLYSQSNSSGNLKLEQDKPSDESQIKYEYDKDYIPDTEPTAQEVDGSGGL